MPKYTLWVPRVEFDCIVLFVLFDFSDFGRYSGLQRRSLFPWQISEKREKEKEENGPPDPRPH